MPINFPSNPANNDVYNYGSQSWYWANNFGVWQSNTNNGYTGSIGFTGSVGFTGSIGYTGSTPVIGGGNTQVFFNDSNYINAVSSFTFNKSDNTFTAGVFTANTTAAYFNGNILPTNTYATSTFASNAYLQSIFIGNTYATSTFASNAYALATFPTNTYATSTFASNAYALATFPTNTYATSTFASNAYLQSIIVGNTYATSTFVSNSFYQTGAITFSGGVKTFSANTTFNANVTYNVDGFFVDTLNKRVGVGNSAPVAELDIYGNYAHIVVAVAASDIDCSLGNYFTKTITGTTTFTFSNVPANRAFGFVLELTNGGSAAVNWPAAVKWPSATAPTLTSSGTDVLVFITDDGGTIWRGVGAMINSS